MSVKRCPDCRGHIQWLATKFGTKLPFDYRPIPATDDVNHAGWIPGEWLVRNARITALAPLGHYGRLRQERVRHVVMVHGCPEYKARIANAMADSA